MSELAISNEHVTVGSGNIFKDLNVPDPDYELMKSELAVKVSDIIKARKLTQKQAAEITGISQPRISQLMNDRLDKVSVGNLLRAAWRLGHRVEVHILPIL